MDIEVELTKPDPVTKPKTDDTVACANTLTDDKINNEADEGCVDDVSLTTTTPEEAADAPSADSPAIANNSLHIENEDKIKATQEVLMTIDEKDKSTVEIDENLDATMDEVVTTVATAATLVATAKITAPMMEKRRYSEAKWASDDEGFAGFDDSSGTYTVFFLSFIRLHKSNAPHLFECF